MSGSWFIRRGEQQWGPLSQKEFDELQLQGHINDEDLISYCKWITWRQVRHFADDRPEKLWASSVSNEITLDTPEGIKRLKPDQALSYLVDNHLRNLGIGPGERWKYQYTDILFDFLKDIGKPGSVHHTKEHLSDAINQAADIIAGFIFASQKRDHPDTSSSSELKRYQTIWKHRDLGQAFREGFTSSEACPLDQSMLSDVAIRYLRQDLRSAKFEILLLDALVAVEVYEYGEELKKNPFKYAKRVSLNAIARTMAELNAYEESKGNLDKLSWAWLKMRLHGWLFRLVLLYVVPIGIALYASERNWGVTTFIAAAFVLVLLSHQLLSWIWRKLRNLFAAPTLDPLQKAFELHAKMVRAYEELKGGIASSPRRVREVLAKIADEGAVWDPSVFSVLDSAITRSGGSWT